MTDLLNEKPAPKLRATDVEVDRDPQDVMVRLLWPRVGVEYRSAKAVGWRSGRVCVQQVSHARLEGERFWLKSSDVLRVRQST